MKDETILLITVVIAITIIEALAICILHIDGVLLSGVVATLAGIALKRQEINYTLGKWLYGNNKKGYR